MRNKIIKKIYFILLLTTIFSSSYIMVSDMFSKDNICCTDADIELLQDSDMSNSTGTSVEHVNDSIAKDVYLFNFDDFSSITNIFFYLQNTYEIYLGLTTPPPKYL